MTAPVSSSSLNITELPQELLAQTLTLIPKSELPALFTVCKIFNRCGLSALRMIETNKSQQSILALRKIVFGNEGEESSDLLGISKISITSLLGLPDIRWHQVTVHEKLAQFFLKHPIVNFLNGEIPINMFKGGHAALFTESEVIIAGLATQRNRLAKLISLQRALEGDQTLRDALSSFGTEFSIYLDFMDAVMAGKELDRKVIYETCRQFYPKLVSLKELSNGKLTINPEKFRLYELQLFHKGDDLNEINDVSLYIQKYLESLTDSFKTSFLQLYVYHYPFPFFKILAGTQVLLKISDYPQEKSVDVQFIQQLLKFKLFKTAIECANRPGVTEEHHSSIALACLEKFGMERAFWYLNSHCLGNKMLIAGSKAFALHLIHSKMETKATDACLNIIAKLLEISDEPEALKNALKQILEACTNHAKEELSTKMREVIRQKNPDLLNFTPTVIEDYSNHPAVRAVLNAANK